MKRCGVLSRIRSKGQSSVAGLPPTLNPTSFWRLARTRVFSQSISCGEVRAQFNMRTIVLLITHISRDMLQCSL